MAAPNLAPSVKPTINQLEELLDAIRFMGIEKDLSRLLPYIANHCVKAIGADRCSIFLADWDKQELWSRHMTGEPGEIRFPIFTGIAGECVKNAKVVMIQDAYNHPLFNKEIDQETGYITKNILCLPLTNNQDNVIGCFEVINKKSGPFSAADTAILSAFGAQAAIAIESALLYEEKEQNIQNLEEAQQDLRKALGQLETVYEIEKYASYTGNIEGMAKTALSKTLEHINAHATAFKIRQGADQFLLLSMVKDQGLETTTIPLNEDQDLRHDVEKILSTSFGSWVTSSLSQVNEKEEREQIGTIGIFRQENTPFSREEEKLLEIISGQVSSVCERQALLSSKSASERMAMIGKLASTIVHDVRSPLTAISSITTLLGLDSDLGEEEKKGFYNTIHSEINRCNNILQELLDYASGRRTIKITKCNLNQLFSDVVTSLKAQAKEKSIKVKVMNDIKEEVLIDSERMMRVIFNIANNAFEVLDKGGEFSISSRLSDQTLILELADNGPGIPESIRASLFEAFVTHGKAKGTGLGLNIVQEIVKAHEGTIRVESSPKGTTFIIEIPQKSN